VAGRKVVIVRSLYELQSAGASVLNHHLARERRNVKFERCKVDPDVWLQEHVNVDPDVWLREHDNVDEAHYYECVFL
jgi:hypothetical protein